MSARAHSPYWYSLLTAVFFLGVLPKPDAAAQEPLEARVARLEARVQALENALARLTGTAGAAQPTAGQPDRSPIMVTLTGKEFYSGSPQDQILLRLQFRNGLAKAVRAFTGHVVFEDLFGREILRVSVTVEEQVNSGGVVGWSGGIDYRSSVPEHERLRTIEANALTTRFIVDMVVYPDGTRERFRGRQ